MTDRDEEPNHQKLPIGDWYCAVQGASFEPQEATEFDDKCPWCGMDIAEVLE